METWTARMARRGYALESQPGRTSFTGIPRLMDVNAVEQGRRVADRIFWEQTATRNERDGGHCLCVECVPHSFTGRLALA